MLVHIDHPEQWLGAHSRAQRGHDQRSLEPAGFYRADPSRPHADRNHGLGLGLAIVAAIASMHGGHAFAESAAGATRIVLVFPGGNGRPQTSTLMSAQCIASRQVPTPDTGIDLYGGVAEHLGLDEGSVDQSAANAWMIGQPRLAAPMSHWCSNAVSALRIAFRAVSFSSMTSSLCVARSRVSAQA